MIKENLFEIKERIRAVARSVGRDPDDIRLVAISKLQPVSKISEAIEGGQRIFGENKVKEAQSKIGLLKCDISWHLVGHLQSNKVKIAVEVFDLIHSVDSIPLAQEISKRAQMISKMQDILVQVNVSGEQTKFGISPGELPDLIHEVAKLPGIRLKGLMTMPPFSSDPEEVRPFFRTLKNLSKKIFDRGWADHDSRIELSMGMSHDFEVAIEEGATLVRIGTAIFGSREKGENS